MKQHITKKQWNELCPKGDKLYIPYISKDEIVLEFNKMNIGQMIEFLGDDLDSILKATSWQIILETKALVDFREVELADALWQAVKYKLNK